MAIQVTHEMHRRRFSRNLGVGLVLGGLVVLVFLLTMVKVQNLGPDSLQGYDHQVQPGLTQVEP